MVTPAPLSEYGETRSRLAPVEMAALTLFVVK